MASVEVRTCTRSLQRVAEHLELVELERGRPWTLGEPREARPITNWITSSAGRGRTGPRPGDCVRLRETLLGLHATRRLQQETTNITAKRRSTSPGMRNGTGRRRAVRLRWPTRKTDVWPIAPADDIPVGREVLADSPIAEPESKRQPQEHRPVRRVRDGYPQPAQRVVAEKKRSIRRSSRFL